VTAISEAVALFDVVPSSTTPITHFAIVLAPGMEGVIMNGDLSPASSFALEVGGLMHVMVDALTNASYGISGSKVF